MAIDATLEYQDTHTTTVNGTAVGRNTFIMAKDMANANSLVSTSNVYGISGTNIEVDLSGGEVEVRQQGSKRFMELMIPTSRIKRTTQSPIRKFIDLKKIEHTLTLKGWLTDDSGTITNTSLNNTALNKKKTLLAIQESGSATRFYFRQEAYACLIKQLDFRDIETEETSSSAESTGMAARLEFTIQLWVGLEK